MDLPVDEPRRRPWGLLAAVGGSAALHLAAGLAAAPRGEAAPADDAPRWVEMEAVDPPPPPPEAAPEPPPEPPPPRRPRRVRFRDTAPEPPAPEAAPADAAPPPEAREIRRVHGLSTQSFAPGSGTGLTVRAGTTLAVPAGAERMDVEEARVSYAAATRPPRCRKPRLEVPDEVVEAGIEGTVEVVFDVDASGRVRHVRVTRPLHPAADAACVAAWARARCRPGRVGREPVVVTDMPHRCTFRAID